MTDFSRLISELIEQEYVPGIIANGRHARPLYELLGGPLPPEPEGVTDRELADWYVDLFWCGD